MSVVPQHTLHHVYDGAAALGAAGSVVATWMNYIEGGLGIMLIIGSLVLVGYRIAVARKELKKEDE